MTLSDKAAARRLAALRVARRDEWEALVRAGEDIGVVSRYTSLRWRRELGLGVGKGGARKGAGRKKRPCAVV